MNVIEFLKASRVWNTEYDLPLVPSQNPWIYGAYIEAIVRLNGERLSADGWLKFYRACEVPGKPGLFKRWPNGSGGPTSHDEVMGVFAIMASIVRDPASTTEQKAEAQAIMDRVLSRLDRNLGTFNSHSLPNWNPFRYNIYRMPWLRTYFLACAGRPVNGFWRWLLCALFLWEAEADANPAIRGPRSRMMNWLMAERVVSLHRQFRMAWGAYKELVSQATQLNNDLRQEPEGVKQEPFISPYAPTDYRHT